ncbi:MULTISPECIES: helix-turn-helix domain-containing protein [Rhodobacterales]|jgi:predicted transcriptional regulator/transcriptional regulator with XRE-family HTH domain|uniref:Cro/Cl family transcriptional regulator n=1 Tax=Phaeobacter gallaeciensis TaxID=60890 RepID=A0A1B0ZNI2_9RHOB|nr:MULTISPECIES: helix-turn-helix transcriptional regulator [Phaeobacter]MDF1770983.1 short-chain fatty acyl-CoA regulator family protein [Pseudophaeobacter sp. bin_em_oilr2.035]MEE2635290.1 short-chain fatty acyl-CoA regulator family protein [Pseudomonadota bacterium]ANP35668.1 Cro/Cl family transcriptional regulator [Phaeobacter gallaeciensis]MDE4061226.1 short-chain fatty acyl-CoA regulator family protein [Phaeobacter gallaeciensis]MDE4098760.1 short-chain fatty acyl-CoA regulator family pr
MATQKLYAGAKLREMRTRLELTQKDFAAKLGVSLPYLNQMENNNRPVSTTVVLALAQEFGMDVTELSTGDSERLVSDMREAMADPVFADDPPPLADLRLTASNAPALARAFLTLHRAYRQTHERLASLDEALGREDARIQASPWEEVRDFFHYCDNYIDAVDRAAERFAGAADVRAAALSALENAGITVQMTDMTGLRSYDAESRTLRLSNRSAPSTQVFQLLLQVALLSQDSLLEATLDFARFQTSEARAIAKIGLANYFAGAALMPYGRFLAAAQETRHDLERLATHFGASIEQVAHRLSTLQRPGAKGIPFFFVRVDQAGTITKRHSATRLQFARFGGACPLWNVHRAFETPGRFLRQLAETPDGVRYLSLAHDVSKPGGSFGSPVRRYAISLGCEVRHADALIYADTLDVNNASAYEPIGISCRICERKDCHQRSVPPLERRLSINADARGVLPYEVS